MDPRTSPTAVDVERASGVEITFGDGFVVAFDLPTLRLHCPCAGCRTDREQGRDCWPKPNSPIPLAIDDAELVGAWALRIVWNDGHGTGVFPWELLRAWGDDGTVTLPPDSGV